MEKGGWRKRGKKNIRELLQLPLLRTPGQKPLSWTLTLWTPYLQNWCIHGINNFTATNYCSCLFEEPWITRHRRPNPQKAERMKCLSAPGAPLPAAAGPERVAQPRLLACVRVNTAAPLQIGEGFCREMSESFHMTQEVKSFHTTRALPFIFTQKMRSKTPLRKPLTGRICFKIELYL